MKQRIYAAALFALLALLANAPSYAQAPATVKLCFGQPCAAVTPSNPLPVNASVSATVGGFTPSAAGARGTPLTVTTSDSSGTLPTGAVVIVSNVGTTNPMYCNVNAVAATTSDQLIGPNSWFAFTIPAAITTLRCIATGGSTTANMLGGAGLATGAGGGSASGGGGGAVTVANGADVALGSTTDAVAAVPADATAATLIALTKAMLNNIASAIPTGGNTIGSVKQTDGTTVVVTDPCQGSTKSYLPITLATAAVKVIATGVAAKKIYICAIDLTNNAADSIAVFEATTGTTCATSAVAVFGAGTSVATAATGYNFAANGGISKGNGGYSVGQTTVNNNDLCIAQSAATQLTGGITYVTQ